MTYQTTNDFDLTRQDGTYTGATGELVVSDGGTITLPTPTAGEKFGVRALRNDVTLLSNGSIEASTSDRRIDSEGNSLFVSDGTEWYLVSGNEYFGFDIPDSVVDNFDAALYEDQGKTLSDYYIGNLSDGNRVQSADARDGGYYYEQDSTSSNSTITSVDSGLPNYPAAGDTITYWTQPKEQATAFYFAVQSESSSRDYDGYNVTLSGGRDRFAICKDDFYGFLAVDDTLTVSTTAWYKVEIDWGSNGDISATLYDDSENSVTSVSATDSTYTSGGIGLTVNQLDTAAQSCYFDAIFIE